MFVCHNCVNFLYFCYTYTFNKLYTYFLNCYKNGKWKINIFFVSWNRSFISDQKMVGGAAEYDDIPCSLNIHRFSGTVGQKEILYQVLSKHARIPQFSDLCLFLPFVQHIYFGSSDLIQVEKCFIFKFCFIFCRLKKKTLDRKVLTIKFHIELVSGSVTNMSELWFPDLKKKMHFL